MTCARNKIYTYKSNFPKAIRATQLCFFCRCYLFWCAIYFCSEVIVAHFEPLKLSSTSFTTHIQFSVSQSFMRLFLFLFMYAEKCRRIFNYIFFSLLVLSLQQWLWSCVVCFFCPSFSACIVHNFPFIWNCSILYALRANDSGDILHVFVLRSYIHRVGMLGIEEHKFSAHFSNKTENV